MDGHIILYMKLAYCMASGVFQTYLKVELNRAIGLMTMFTLQNL